jgi:hypothetical protein
MERFWSAETNTRRRLTESPHQDGAIDSAPGETDRGPGGQGIGAGGNRENPHGPLDDSDLDALTIKWPTNKIIKKDLR